MLKEDAGIEVHLSQTKTGEARRKEVNERVKSLEEGYLSEFDLGDEVEENKEIELPKEEEEDILALLNSVD